MWCLDSIAFQAKVWSCTGMEAVLFSACTTAILQQFDHMMTHRPASLHAILPCIYVCRDPSSTFFLYACRRGRCRHYCCHDWGFVWCSAWLSVDSRAMVRSNCSNFLALNRFSGCMSARVLWVYGSRLLCAATCGACRFDKLENGHDGRDAAVALALQLASLDVK